MTPTPFLRTTPGRGRRLQRSADFTGDTLTRFREVFVRHGLPGLLLVPLLLLHDAPRTVLATMLRPALDAPARSLALAVGILLALLAIGWVRDRRLTSLQAGWTVYLGALSAWEEFVFRVALPAVLVASGADPIAAVLGVNLAFGAMHWFTLRWRMQWCVMAALGGLAFARMLEVRGDLAAVIAVHWIATFLNTPRPPSGRGNGGEDDAAEARQLPPASSRASTSA